jgi:hypothetical protein
MRTADITQKSVRLPFWYVGPNTKVQCSAHGVRRRRVTEDRKRSRSICTLHASMHRYPRWGMGCNMLGWLRRRRERIEHIEAEAEALVDELGFGAYAEARLRERDANDFSELRYWSQVTLAIARKVGKRVALDSATRMTISADFARMLETTGQHDQGRPQLESAGSLRPEKAQASSFRLQFLGASADGSWAVLAVVEVRALDVSAAIREAARIAWPPRAIGFRLIDRQGHEVFGATGSAPR